jgi:hypothetical protein
MKTYVTVILLGICILAPLASFAALDWNIRWDEANSPHTAKVYIFNPEDTFQTFTLEIGDIAKPDSADQYAPYLIIGQDVSLLQIAPSERRIFDIIVYRDIDSNRTLTTASNEKPAQLSSEKHQQELRILGKKYGGSKSREYPVAILGIQPVVREEPSENRAIYRNKRGYWIVTIVDHDHIAEQLIRTGDQMGAQFGSIQQAIFYYTQGDVQLTDEALEVWETAFPELKAEVSPTPYPYGDCVYFVTVVTANLSYYAASRTITVGDILASSNPLLSPVVAAEDLNFSVSPNTQSSKRLLRVYLMSPRGQPSEQSEYVKIITHNSQIEQAIRIGTAEQYHACAIQDVIFYINHEVPSLTIGKGLWDRLGGTLPPVPTPGRPSVCLGNPTTQPLGGQTLGMTFKNLLVLIGAIVPFSVLFRRKRRKP